MFRSPATTGLPLIVSLVNALNIEGSPVAPLTGVPLSLLATNALRTTTVTVLDAQLVGLIFSQIL